VRSVKIVIRGFSAFPEETAGFVSGYRYLESARDLQTAIFHSSLLLSNYFYTFSRPIKAKQHPKPIYKYIYVNNEY
jgi:hypothetical protein